MLHSTARGAFVILLVVLVAQPATAQLIPGWDSKQFTFEQLDAERIRLMREVEINGVGANAGQQIFADELIWNLVTGDFEATGNVLLASPTARLSAERVVFNTKTGLGTFYTASGQASLGERAMQDKSMFGTLEPDVYFYGETIEKIADDKYRITNGSFTTCVQPTPRWDVVSGSATIDLEDYAVLRNAVIRVKDVPVFYLPVMYYPIQSDDRATGFLLPTYGNSTYRGKSISNAFFWAINRAQDLTLFHDWFLGRGQGAGSEYRYAAGVRSYGNLRAYRLSSSGPTLGTGDAVSESLAYELRGALVQEMPAGISARASLDYFSDITTKQLYNNNLYDATLGRRSISGGVTKSWSGATLNGIYQRTETFYTAESSFLSGSAPGISASLSSRQLGRLPIFVGGTGDYSRIVYTTRSYDGDEVEEDDNGLSSYDTSGTVRSPFSKLPFLTTTASLTYRLTRFSHSFVNGVHSPVPLNRRYAQMGLESFGPTFTKVFSPNNAIADRLKHVIEPYFSLQKTTSIDDADRISSAAGSIIIGNVTKMSYGLDTRVLVRKTGTGTETVPSATAPRELFGVSLRQTYYTNPLASRYDYYYPLSSNYRPASSYSPYLIQIRSSPVTGSTINFNMEYDAIDQTGKLQGFGLTGSVTRAAVQASGGWSQRKYATGSSGLTADNYIQAASTVTAPGGRMIASGSLSYDIKRNTLMQHRWTGSYNAQCCGIAIEFQEYNFPQFDTRFPVAKDRRFNLSFTLAGIGSFSNFFGTFGGDRY